jgi:type I restriction enzyme M protein
MNPDKAVSLGFEDKLWAAADVLRSNLDPAEYKHVVLGLVFLKYVSDAFEEHRAQIVARGAPAEDRQAYAGVFWVPEVARWSALQAKAAEPTIGVALDGAMAAIEADNPALKGVLPRVFGSSSLEAPQLGALIELLSGLGLGTAVHRQRDTLGRVYEYFLARFASAEGRGGGEFYTPSSVVRVLVEVLEPYRGRVYDPCCGSGGMFVQSLAFVDAHGGRRDAVTVHGQESNATTWRMARMNLTVRGIEADLGAQPADTLHHDAHPDLRADFVMANPPFNISRWGGERLTGDARWRYGAPPANNANFAWLQHIVHHLAPTGAAGVVLANGSMSSQQSGEGDIRRALVEADVVDCMVAMPGQLFYATQIPVCVWFLARDKRGGRRSRAGEVLFVDARALGRMETRVHRVFDADDVAKIAGTYHAWRDGVGYADVPGFCKAATLAELRAHDFVLTPGRYVGAEDVPEDGEPFDEKLGRLMRVLQEQQAEERRLDEEILRRLRSVVP